MELARWSRVLAPTLAAVLSLAPALGAQTYPPGGDPRDNLKAGLHDAGEAAKGMKLVGHTGKPAEDKYLKVVARHLRNPAHDAAQTNPSVGRERASIAKHMMA